jgi:hypothetical protein
MVKRNPADAWIVVAGSLEAALQKAFQGIRLTIDDCRFLNG